MAKSTHFQLQHPDGRTFNLKNELKDTVKELIANGDNAGLEKFANDNHTPEASSGIRMKSSKKKYQTGGSVSQGNNQMEQLMQATGQLLQKGHQPKEVMSILIKQGLQPQQAQQIVQAVMQQMQGRSMQDGGQMQQDPNQQPQQQGGDQQQQMQQLMQMVMQALQQGKQPQEIMQMLVQQGVPQQVAQQVVQAAMQQMQGSQQQGPQEEQQEPQQEAPQQEQQEGQQEPPQAKSGKWIQKAVNPKHKGYCTPMTKATCTPRRKALARTFKKHHGFHKAQDGTVITRTPEYNFPQDREYYPLANPYMPSASDSTAYANTFNQYLGNPGIVDNHIAELNRQYGLTTNRGERRQLLNQIAAMQDAQKNASMYPTIKRRFQQGGQVDQSQQPIAQGTPQDGGQQQMEQLMAMVAQELQKGVDPRQILQELVQQGVPQEQAQQVIQQVMQQMQQGGGQDQQQQQQPQEQQQPPMKYGGIKRAQLGTQLGKDTSYNSPENQEFRAQQEQQSQQNAINQQNSANNFAFLNRLKNKYNGQGMNAVPEGFNSDLSDQPVSDYERVSDYEGPTQQPFNPSLTYSLASRNPKQKVYLDDAQRRDYTSYVKNQDQFPQVSNKQLSTYYNAPYYVRKGMEFGWNDQANTKERDLLKNAGASQQDLKGLNKRISADKAGIAGSVIGEVSQDILQGVGGISADIHNQNVMNMDRNRLIARNKENRAPILPYRGDESELGGGTRAMMTRYGGEIPCKDCGGRMEYGGKLGFLKHGGKGVEPNVVTEQGEVINNTHSVYKDGGVKHSDPSGGNYKYLLPGSVVHSASLGIKVGDLLGLMGHSVQEGKRPGTYSSAKWGKKIQRFEYGGQVQEDNDKPTVTPEEVAGYVKQKLLTLNPNKEMKFSKIASLFETEDYEKKLAQLGKKIDKEGLYANAMEETSISKITSKLNQATLGKQKQDVAKEKELNLQATGPNGPLYQVAENLKQQGAYGPDVQQEAIDQNSGGAQYGKRILQLPRAQNGAIMPDPSDGRSYQLTGKHRVGPQGLDQIEYKDKQGNSVWGLAPGSGTPKSGLRVNSTERLSVDPVTGENIYYTSPSAESPFDPKYGGPYKTRAGEKLPAGYADPETLKEVTEETALNYPLANLALGVDPKSVKAVQQVQTTETPLEVIDAYKQGYLRFNNAHKELLKRTDEYGKLGRKGDPLPQDYNILLQNHQEDILAGHEDNTWGKDAIRYQTIKFNKGEENLYNSWLKDQRPVGSHFIDKDYTQTEGEQPVYWKPDISELDLNKVKEEPKAKDYEVKKLVSKNPQVYSRRPYYTEALNPMQIYGPMMDLTAPIESVPYIEDQGAKDALAAATRQRYTDIQPQLNRLRRGTLAQTRYINSPVGQALGANAYANEYEAANQAYGEKYNRDAALQQQYDQMQNELRMRAGANKASALNQLAERTGVRDWKAYALARNAAAEIGNKYAQNRLEKKTAMLEQNMYPNTYYNGMTTNIAGTNAPYIGGGSNLAYNKDVQEAQYRNARTKLMQDRDAILEMEHNLGYAGTPASIASIAPTTSKYGGKVKLPKKSVKRIK